MKESSHWVPSLFAKGIKAIRSSWQQKNKGINGAKLLGALHLHKRTYNHFLYDTNAKLMGSYENWEKIMMTLQNQKRSKFNFLRGVTP
jgi:hypothetical protein